MTSASSTRDGDLFLVDRLKELVIVSGFNVYPIEVEDVIAEVDGVAEAAVIGVDRTRVTGEAVVAYVRPVPGSSCDADELEDAGPASTAGSGWPGSSSRPRSRRRRPAAHGDRQGGRRAGCAASRRRSDVGLLE